MREGDKPTDGSHLHQRDLLPHLEQTQTSYGEHFAGFHYHHDRRKSEIRRLLVSSWLFQRMTLSPLRYPSKGEVGERMAGVPSKLVMYLRM
jgi:hypothetical protein